jgi:hypothetical protein
MTCETYSDLAEEVFRLPRPEPDKVRVFRGQTEDYGRMLPTRFRKSREIDVDLWYAYAAFLASELREQRNESASTDAMDLLLWVRAIGQHYGPGSEFLDVTRSLDIALWFALHEWEIVERIGIMGPRGPIDPKTDVPTISSWLKCKTTKQKVGWIYVFDVPEWSPESRISPKHGDLVDVLKGPPVFASRRISVQNACLLCSDARADEGNLSSFYSCRPICVLASIAGAPRLHDKVETLFPLPDVDPWYARLLAIPHVLRVRTKPDIGLYFSRPLDIKLYVPSDLNSLKKLVKYDVGLNPPLLYPDLLAHDEHEQQIKVGLISKARLTNATPILLEAPIMFSTPPSDSDLWNAEVLTSDLDSTVDAIDLVSGESLGPVRIDNAFIEFSALESPVVDLDGEEWKIERIRGIWLVRKRNEIFVTPFVYSPTKGTWSAGPLVADYDATTRNIEFRIMPSGKTLELSKELLSRMRKWTFASLMVLRDLGSRLKALSYPHAEGVTQGDVRRIVVGVSKSIAHLEKLPRTARWNVDCYFPRYMISRKPYLASYGPGNEGILNFLTIEGVPSYSSCEYDRLRERLKDLSSFKAA